MEQLLNDSKSSDFKIKMDKVQDIKHQAKLLNQYIQLMSQSKKNPEKFSEYRAQGEQHAKNVWQLFSYF